MEITSLKFYKGRTYEVIIDSERTFYLHIDTITDFGLEKNMRIERDELKKIIYASNFRRAFEYSLYCLDYRDYSSHELLKKITEKYKSEKLCLDVIKKLEEENIINDFRYAEKLAVKFVEVKKYGYRRARQEIILKGISADTADDILERYNDLYYENLTELIRQKYSRLLMDKTDRKSTDKVKNALVRLGYDFENINSAIKEYFCNLQ